MNFLIILFVFPQTTVFSAMVREFPFLFNTSDIEENVTSIEEVTAMTTLFSEVFEQLIHLEDETNETAPEVGINWSSAEGTPILSALRNFWAHAKTGLLDPKDPLSEGAINENTEHVVKAIEHGLWEATTMLINRIEETTLTTLPTKDLVASTEPTVLTKRQGIITPPEKNSNVGQKRQTAFDLMANMSTSCSNCYEKLQKCVHQCFIENDCNDVQRKVRSCPPVPNRLCSFFTQWSPVDECINHSDCKSPLLCCNDGCGNKCVSGVWNS
ncbi:uncharacterized protein [Parasteatoda tepidariorum]|uniref:uncharacterized protein isoform X2 n=1 Tax=Parasteatoda tepidariorum TaxID=114398 RepID=UPI00077FDF29|nr:uncharacterized protein LOC107440327 isoform X2 [Parasteatoda tepidariorum]